MSESSENDTAERFNFYDICLEVKEELEESAPVRHVACDKRTLKMTSPFLKTVIGESGIYTVNNFNYETVGLAVAFMHGVDIDIGEENVVELLKISIAWRLNVLMNDCEDFVRSVLNLKNVLKYHKIVLKHGLVNLQKGVSYFIRMNFLELKENKEFCNMDIKDFLKILDHDEINVSSEDDIFLTVLDVLDKKGDQGYNWYEKVRFDHLAFELLVLFKTNEILQSPPINKLYREAYLYQFKKRDIPKTQPRSRIKSLVCIKNDRVIYKYDEVRVMWEDIVLIPYWVDNSTTVVSSNDSLIFVGKYHRKTKACRININSGAITEIQSLDEAIECPIVSVNDDDIFVFSLDKGTMSMKHFVTHTKSWKPTMIFSLSASDVKPVTATFGHVIYFLKEFENVNELRTFAITTQSSAPIGGFCWRNSDCGIYNMLLYKSNLIIMNSEELIIYKPVENDWEYTKEIEKNGEILKMFDYDEQITCLVKKDGLLKLFFYDLRRNHWKPLDVDVSDVLFDKHVYSV